MEKARQCEHTPGPWAWDRHGRLFADSMQWPLAERKGGALDSDAQLIASAPALLATLERIANSCEEFATDPQCDADPYDLCEAMAQDARAAIAAARGEG